MPSQMPPGKNVFIISGLPGSGKSTLAKNYTYDSKTIILSADDYFMSEGIYKFDPSKIGDAHKDCFNRFLNVLQEDTLLRKTEKIWNSCNYIYDAVIVDNTNIEAWEISPYWMVATGLGYNVKIIEVHTSLKFCVENNKHDVPYNVLRMMQSKWTARQLPAHWHVEGVFTAL